MRDEASLTTSQNDAAPKLASFRQVGVFLSNYQPKRRCSKTS